MAYHFGFRCFGYEMRHRFPNAAVVHYGEPRMVLILTCSVRFGDIDDHDTDRKWGSGYSIGLDLLSLPLKE